MSEPVEPIVVGYASLAGLDDCGCAEGITALTPAARDNRPGLSAIAYRAGTHHAFKRTLLARLSTPELPALAALATRADDDFAIALLDAWATVADVLTFYQERLATESYLRTATERRSMRELGRLVGYAPRPGVGASVRLAFTLEEGPGSPRSTRLEAGLKVQSLPGPDETAQTFETIEPIEARPAWNAIRPRRAEPHPLTVTTTTLVLPGITGAPRAGDGVLFLAGGSWVFAVVESVTVEPRQDRTVVQVAPRPDGPKLGSEVPELGAAPPPLGGAAARLEGQVLTAADLTARARTERFDPQEVFDALAAGAVPGPRVMLFRAHAAVFGHNAPESTSLPFGLDPGVVDLDGPHATMASGRSVVLWNGETDVWAVYAVERAADVSVARFGLSARVTRLTLEDAPALLCFGLRSTTVFGQAEVLSLAPVAREDAFPEPAPEGSPQWLALEGWVDGLTPGQRVVIGGDADDAAGTRYVEEGVIAGVSHDLARGGGTRVVLEGGVERRYRRGSVAVNANVATATHGETVREIVGSGDGGRASQRFTLRQHPLTHVSAATTEGAVPALEVRVNGVRWHRVPTLDGQAPGAHVYTMALDEAGAATIEFGDGASGARLPTGPTNVGATYRKGLGRQGLVRAGQLGLLMSRPLGLRGVTNPRPSEGGDDPETAEAARTNVPLGVRTLGRIVALRDYEDFARAFAGIAKAHVTWGWDGRRRIVLVTVVGPDGAVVAPGSETHDHLWDAMKDARDPHVAVRLVPHRPAPFRVAGTVTRHPDHRPEAVHAAVEQALRDRLGFAARALGEPVARSEVIAVIQGAPGVEAVTLSSLLRCDAVVASWPPPRYLLAAPPEVGSDGEALGAELLSLDLAPLTGLTVVP